LCLFYRLMGAKVGANVHLATDSCSTFDLLSIGDDSSIGTDASLDGCTVEQGLLKIGPIEIGRGCFVGTRAVLREHSRMADGARLEDLSLLPRGANIPAGETWVGSPAQVRQPFPLGRAATQATSADAAAPARPSQGRRAARSFVFALGVMVFPLLVIGAIFPGMMLMNHLNAVDEFSYSYLVVSPLVALSFVVLLCLEIAAIKWLLLGKVRAGSYPVTGSFYFRKWFVDQMLELSLDVIGTLYSTIYLLPWYRLLGAKLGRRAEVSTASFISPDLLSIDDEGFVADCASLGAARLEGGMMTIAGTHIGKRSFIGNSALLPPGAVVGDNCLIGCLSAPPPVETGPVPSDTSWLGSPAMFLPARQRNGHFAESTTFAPTRLLWLKRGAIELGRVILPATFFIALTNVLLAELIVTKEELPLWHMLLLFPIVYAVFGSVAALIVIVLKWVLMGRYRPGEQPLWSTFVWRTELISGLQENLSDLFLVNKLTGTPLVCWFFRMMGAKIGKRVYLGTTQFTEYDLVEIGDDVALNTDCTIQTHLFEDRVMKMAPIKIGDRCSVGGMSLVLYATRMENGSTLGDLSLLMKGEVLPPGSRWQGIPARCDGD
jgi:non-ribosomal peptide synthetase-like protein